MRTDYRFMLSRLAFLALLILSVCACQSWGQQYALLGNPSRTLDEQEIAQVSLVTIRLRPGDIYDGRSFHWSWADGQVNRCRRLGRRYGFILMGGDHSKPWTKANIDRWRKLHLAMGVRYSSDPLCVSYTPTGCTEKGKPSELQWRDITPAIFDAQCQLIDVCAAAFPTQAIILRGNGRDTPDMLRLVNYGLARAPGRFAVGHNALQADTNLSAKHNQYIIEATRRGAGQWLQMACCCAFDPGRFGSPDVMDGVEMGRELARLAGYPVQLQGQEIYPGDIQDLR